MSTQDESKREKRQEIATWVSIGIAFLLFVTLIAGMVIFACHQDAEHQKYLDSLSPEELEAYYESNRARYEIVSVSMYTTPITNSFGGVKRTDINYVIRYIDGDTIKEMKDLEYTDFRIGDVNQYVIDDNINKSYIIITKETLEGIK